jgi:hypothetical protein
VPVIGRGVKLIEAVSIVCVHTDWVESGSQVFMHTSPNLNLTHAAGRFVATASAAAAQSEESGRAFGRPVGRSRGIDGLINAADNQK